MRVIRCRCIECGAQWDEAADRAIPVLRRLADEGCRRCNAAGGRIAADILDAWDPALEGVVGWVPFDAEDTWIL